MPRPISSCVGMSNSKRFYELLRLQAGFSLFPYRLHITNRNKQTMSKSVHPVSKESCSTIATQSLRILEHIISLRQLERLLALSQGYLSRIKYQSGNPSPQLAMLLYLMALSPRLFIGLLSDLRGYPVEFRQGPQEPPKRPTVKFS